MKASRLAIGLLAAVLVLGLIVILTQESSRTESTEDRSVPSVPGVPSVPRAARADRSVVRAEGQGEIRDEARPRDPRREDRGGEVRHSKREGLLEQAQGWEQETVSTSTSVHPISATGIRSAVRASVPELRECYEGWLQQNPKIGGRLTVGFTIATDPNDATKGKVTKVEMRDSDVGHVFMESCVLAVFEDLAFEAPKDGTLKVTYPLTFSNDENP